MAIIKLTAVKAALIDEFRNLSSLIDLRNMGIKCQFNRNYL